MSKPFPTKETLTFDQSAKDEIIENLFKRVPNSIRRSQIIALATELSNNRTNDKEFYSAVYHYSLRENWPELDNDFKEFLGSGVVPVNDDGSIGDEPRQVQKGAKPSKRRKKGSRGK